MAVCAELMMNEDTHIKSCVMFGQGKFQNGVLVEPKPEFAIDPNDNAQVEAFRTLIWCVLRFLRDLTRGVS